MLTAAWASWPGSDEACLVRHRCHRVAACAHRELRRDEARRVQPCQFRDGWGDAVAYPCPAPERRGCCPGVDRSDVWPDRVWVHRDATERDESMTRGRSRLAGWLRACWHPVLMGVLPVLPDELEASEPLAWDRALHRALPGSPLERREPTVPPALPMVPESQAWQAPLELALRPLPEQLRQPAWPDSAWRPQQVRAVALQVWARPSAWCRVFRGSSAQLGIPAWRTGRGRIRPSR